MWHTGIATTSQRLHKRIWQGKNTEWYWEQLKHKIAVVKPREKQI